MARLTRKEKRDGSNVLLIQIVLIAFLTFGMAKTWIAFVVALCGMIAMLFFGPTRFLLCCGFAIAWGFIAYGLFNKMGHDMAMIAGFFGFLIGAGANYAGAEFITED